MPRKKSNTTFNTTYEANTLPPPMEKFTAVPTKVSVTPDKLLVEVEFEEETVAKFKHSVEAVKFANMMNEAKGSSLYSVKK